MRRWLVQLVAVGAGVGVVLLGLAALHRMTRDRLGDLDRSTAAFSDIDCPAPPNQDRADFLAEVQYLADMPARLRLLDEDLPSGLAAAFARHPWVEEVERVEIRPPRSVRVQPRYRIPVLAVRADEGGHVRAVDSRGVVLPSRAPLDGLPTLTAATRLGAAGKPWGDPLVEGAARTAALLREDQARLRLTVFENGPKGLTLKTAAGTRVLWGQPPGAEAAGEAAAAAKVERLLEYCREHHDLDGPDGPYEHDVRPAGQATRRPPR
jgi:hypothetical protein